jgi:hypothetical protein
LQHLEEEGGDDDIPDGLLRFFKIIHAKVQLPTIIFV